MCTGPNNNVQRWYLFSVEGGGHPPIGTRSQAPAWECINPGGSSLLPEIQKRNAPKGNGRLEPPRPGRSQAGAWERDREFLDLTAGGRGPRLLRKRAFTLLEVMLAVAILALIAVSIFRFVMATVTAVQVSSEQIRDTVLMEAFSHYLREQMQALPPGRQGAIIGEAHRFDGVSTDELRWVCGPGPGLFTRNASGEWFSTLTIQRAKLGKGYVLGLRRQDVDARTEPSWLPLLGGINAFEVRYFDPRAMAWMEKWTDNLVRPALVRIKLWRSVSPDPYEVVYPLPVVPLQPPGAPPPGAPGVPPIPGVPGALPGQPGAGVPGGPGSVAPIRGRR